MTRRVARTYARLHYVLWLVALFSGPVLGENIDDGYTAWRDGRYSDALRIWTPLAKQGDAALQFNVGWMYDHGKGAPEDNVVAINWYRLAAEQNDFDAIYRLIQFFGLGREVGRDEVEVERLLSKLLKTAVAWQMNVIRQDAIVGEPIAQFILAYSYAEGIGAEQDRPLAAKWYITSAERGLSMAQYELAWLYEVGSGVEVDHKKAVHWMKEAAHQGDPDAEADLGLRFLDGNGVPQNELMGFQWSLKAAEKNVELGQLTVARLYLDGVGVSRDVKKAFNWYRKAAELGSTEGHYRLAGLIFEGVGVRANAALALEWLDKLAREFDSELVALIQNDAEAGNTRWAQFVLGYCYKHGYGVDADLEIADRWYQLAADQGHTLAIAEVGSATSPNDVDSKQDCDSDFCRLQRSAEAGEVAAQMRLAAHYLDGDGVDKNDERAFHWMERAAKSGDATAQSNLGVFYMRGIGVTASKSKAFLWYQRSAEQGDPYGQYNIGESYFYGRGTAKSDKRAVEWIRRFVGQMEQDMIDKILAQLSQPEMDDSRGYAMLVLGLAYSEGRASLKDASKARHWFQKAAEEGAAVARKFVANMSPNTPVISPLSGEGVIDIGYGFQLRYRDGNVNKETFNGEMNDVEFVKNGKVVFRAHRIESLVGAKSTNNWFIKHAVLLDVRSEESDLQIDSVVIQGLEMRALSALIDVVVDGRFTAATFHSIDVFDDLKCGLLEINDLHFSEEDTAWSVEQLHLAGVEQGVVERLRLRGLSVVANEQGDTFSIDEFDYADFPIGSASFDWSRLGKASYQLRGFELTTREVVVSIKQLMFPSTLIKDEGFKSNIIGKFLIQPGRFPNEDMQVFFDDLGADKLEIDLTMELDVAHAGVIDSALDFRIRARPAFNLSVSLEIEVDAALVSTFADLLKIIQVSGDDSSELESLLVGALPAMTGGFSLKHGELRITDWRFLHAIFSARGRTTRESVAEVRENAFRPIKEYLSKGSRMSKQATNAIEGLFERPGTLVVGVSPAKALTLSEIINLYLLPAKLESSLGIRISYEAGQEIAGTATTPKTNKEFSGKDQWGKTGTGTGVFIDKRGHLVTNNHVIKDCDRIGVSFLSARREARVIVRNQDNDLALLGTSFNSMTPAIFRKGAVRVGEDILAIGYPFQGLLSDDLKVTKGVVNSVAGPGNDRRYLQMDAPVQPGNSGGPLLDGAGHVVGIVTARLGRKFEKKYKVVPQNINFAVQSTVVEKLLRKKNIKYQSDDSKERLITPDIVEAARRFTALVECWESLH